MATSQAYLVRRTATRRRIAVTAKVLLFMGPWIIGFLAFRLYPLLATVYYSLTFYTVLQPPVFIGVQNFITLLSGDPRFQASLYDTVYYALLSVPLSNAVAIILAMLLNMKVRGLAAYRTIYYLPSITPLVAVAIAWLWIFNPEVGIINWLLSLIGVRGPGWLADPTWAKPALVIMSIWGVGAAVVIYLAGLQDAPQELYEAASIDGADELTKVWTIALPMLSPVILFNVVISLIGAFQYFTQIYVMTQGGPTDSTLMFSYYLYESAFQYFKMGYASAMALILFIIVVVFTAIVFKLSGHFVYYGGR